MASSTSRRRRRLSVVSLLACVLLAAAVSLAADEQERVDLDALYRIKQEGFQRSQVMDITSWLTDVHGPRLTGSPSYDAAAAWVRKTLTDWGLVKVMLDPFEFGRSWSNERISVHVVEPSPWPVIAYPKAWTPGTNGPVRGEVVPAAIEREEDFAKFKGTLKGKIVLASTPREVAPAFEPSASRFSEKELEELARQDPKGAEDRRRRYAGLLELVKKRTAFFQSEGVMAVIEASRVGDGGTVFVQGGGSRDAADPPSPTQIVVAVEHYGRIWRTVAKNIPVVLELDVKNTFHDATTTANNVLGEIPGTDLAGEVVMLGCHLDSWNTGTGATDDAAGCAVVLEAARILEASHVTLRRTVRLGLWAGEEQGILGSRSYVQRTFADRETMTLKPEHGRVSAYFNVDNGTGAIRGVYLQGNEVVAPIFRAWMAPFANLGMTTLTIRDTGGTDHLSFDAVGIPGFQFIQDTLDYDTRTHHSNMDVYERVQSSDMMKNAVIVASFVYQAANRDQILPRKPLPPPEAPRKRPQTTAGGAQ